MVFVLLRIHVESSSQCESCEVPLNYGQFLTTTPGRGMTSIHVESSSQCESCEVPLNYGQFFYNDTRSWYDKRLFAMWRICPRRTAHSPNLAKFNDHSYLVSACVRIFKSQKDQKHWCQARQSTTYCVGTACLCTQHFSSPKRFCKYTFARRSNEK